MLPRLIALEEHFDTGLFPSDLLHDNLPAHLHDKLHDLHQGRIQDLDAGSISMQVISYVGCWTPVQECIESNNRLARACKKYPNRFAGFAQLPMQDPDAAVGELERTINELHFVGALLNNHTEDGSMYDDSKFWPVFEKAVELNVPIYIHPTYPAENMEPHYRGSFPPAAAIMMSTAGFGWHSETGLHILRLFASGLFDKLPALRIIIGHMGELLPFMLDRICKGSRSWGTYERDLRTVWRENIYVTTSGMFTLPPLECLLKMSKPDHVMFSIDYPFSTCEMGLQFVEEIERSGTMSREQLEDFCHGNAERLLKLNVPGP